MPVEVARTALVAAHAGLATVCFAVGLTLLVAPRGPRAGLRTGVFAALAVLAMASLLAVVALDWPRLDVGRRLAFGGLAVLGLVIVLRAVLAEVAVRDREAGWTRAVIGHVGFVLIALLDGFCVVTAVDLGAPPPATAAVAVLGVAVGVVGLRVALRRESGAATTAAGQ